MWVAYSRESFGPGSGAGVVEGWTRRNGSGMRNRRHVALLLFAGLMLGGKSAFAASLIDVTFERDGRVILGTYNQDGGSADAATVWRHLGRKPIMVAESPLVLANTADPMRADLGGDVTVSVRHAGRLIARARVPYKRPLILSGLLRAESRSYPQIAALESDSISGCVYRARLWHAMTPRIRNGSCPANKWSERLGSRGWARPRRLGVSGRGGSPQELSPFCAQAFGGSRGGYATSEAAT